MTKVQLTVEDVVGFIQNEMDASRHQGDMFLDLHEYNWPSMDSVRRVLGADYEVWMNETHFCWKYTNVPRNESE